MSRTRPLGDTGMDITPLGFGTWVIAGSGWQYSWGATDDAESIAAVRHAVDSGLNWLDTAPAYGLGHAETLVGKALADMPEAERPYLFTKTGLIWEEGDDRTGPPRRITRPETIRAELEASLRRLRVEHIDLYQVHWPDTGAVFVYGGEGAGLAAPTPLEEYWRVMADLEKEGKVRAIGLLTGAFTADRKLTADDWRSGRPDFTTGLSANLALVDALRPIAARHGVSVAEVALAWVNSWPGVTAAIVGARTSTQIDGWTGALTLELSPADLEEIATAINSTGAGTGPARP
ncbi:aldo/keto reductase [Nocardia sp. NBC_01388]|uniref:aldo/keto reductase n=1 Tax=Nocardia sp. NBC_01388 TaxID=2903596 RepID=UPI0032514330